MTAALTGQSRLAFVAFLFFVELLPFVFLWYGPLLLERSTVRRLRPLAYGLALLYGAVTVGDALSGRALPLISLVALPALVYVAYTWSDRYTDQLQQRRLRSQAGRRRGRWREGIESRQRDR